MSQDALRDEEAPRPRRRAPSLAQLQQTDWVEGLEETPVQAAPREEREQAARVEAWRKQVVAHLRRSLLLAYRERGYPVCVFDIVAPWRALAKSARAQGLPMPKTWAASLFTKSQWAEVGSAWMPQMTERRTKIYVPRLVLDNPEGARQMGLPSPYHPRPDADSLAPAEAARRQPKARKAQP